VQRLVGKEFFDGAARIFIGYHPPQSAYLNAYGAAFGDFFAQFPPAASLAYLPDVARLEWAVNIALHAEDVAPLDPACLSSLDEDKDIVFIPNPSVVLLQTTYPADAIWRAVIEEDDEALDAIDLLKGPFFLIVARREESISVYRMDKAEWAFASALFAGVPLSRALAATGSDMSPTLAAHLAAGYFCDAHNREQESAP
jgi:hypothetical protein